MIPASTVLRLMPGRRLVVGRNEVLHVYAGEVRARCGWRLDPGAIVLEEVGEAPPVRVCARCLRSLPPVQVQALRPEPEELAAVHDRAARLVAQRCIEDLERIRKQMRVDGTATTPVTYVRAAPARDPRAPRPTTRTARYAQQSGHVAKETTTTLAGFLNMLTPGGYAIDQRLYLLDPPAPGSRVDPQGRRP